MEMGHSYWKLLEHLLDAHRGANGAGARPLGVFTKGYGLVTLTSTTHARHHRLPKWS